MALRICLVTPFAWSQPHDVNEHVAGIARSSARSAMPSRSSHRRTAPPSSQPAASRCTTARSTASELVDPRPGRADLAPQPRGRARRRADEPLARAPLRPLRRRARLRARPAEPVVPRAARRREPRGRDVLLAGAPRRIRRDARSGSGCSGGSTSCSPSSEDTAAAAAVRFPGDYRVVSEGVDTSLFEPAEKERLIVLEWRPTERPLHARGAAHARRAPGLAADAPPHEAADDAAVRPAHARRPRRRADGARLAEPRRDPQRGGDLRARAPNGLSRLALEAAAAGAAVAVAAGHARAAAARRGRDGPARRRRDVSRAARAPSARGDGRATDLHRRRARARGDLREPARHAKRTREARRRAARATATGSSSTSTCTRARRTTAASPPELLLEHAEAEGLGAIAVTDHNVFSGAQEVVEARARPRHRRHPRRRGEDRRAGRGDRPLPERGDPARDVVRRHDRGDQGAGRRSSTSPIRSTACTRSPTPATLHRHLGADRRLRGLQRAAALRDVQRRGAALRAQVQPDDGRRLRRARAAGRRHRRVRMRAFDGPEEFLLSLRTAEILRRPKSLLYLQSLKWAAQAKERVR